MKKCKLCKKEGKNIIYGISYCEQHTPNEKEARKNAMIYEE